MTAEVEYGEWDRHREADLSFLLDVDVSEPDVPGSSRFWIQVVSPEAMAEMKEEGADVTY